ncbi:MAG: superoxide dismutase family protein [Oscillospiraceae bacterium]
MQSNFTPLIRTLMSRPSAEAVINGSAEYPDLSGWVKFYQTDSGVLVYAQLKNLPMSSAPCKNRVFAFHIHENGKCSGNSADPFADVGGHYNPGGCPHPYHAGDLPPLFGNNGLALSVFLTDRFTVGEIIGRAVIIHEKPDDFASQPSGNAGAKIACGKITETIF